jgi:putative transposase
MGRGLSFAQGEFYHVYNRGTDKRRVFCDNYDYQRFLGLLYLCNQDKRIELTRSGIAGVFDMVRIGEPLVSIAAYCLMPNHFHLLIKEINVGGVSLFMQKLTTAHTMHFNKRRARPGALFESSFKARHVDNDIYLKYLIAYMHLNPIKLIDPQWKERGIRDLSEAQMYLESYTYSSYLDYSGIKRPEQAIIDTSALPAYFDSSIDFQMSVTEWLKYSIPPEEV